MELKYLWNGVVKVGISQGCFADLTGDDFLLPFFLLAYSYFARYYAYF